MAFYPLRWVYIRGTGGTLYMLSLILFFHGFQSKPQEMIPGSKRQLSA